MTDEAFLAAFQDTSLPRAQWTHEAHVRMAFLMLSRGEGLDEIREGIRRYNAAQRSSGYHETITIAFVRLVQAALVQTPGIDWFAFAQAYPALFPPQVLERHYAPETLRSPEARATFVAPDRQPLP